MPEEITGGRDAQRKLRVYVATFGCQMNEYDSEVAEGILERAGFEVVESPQGAPHPNPLPNGERGTPKVPGEGDIDVILMNTCSVREHAEDRVYGRLGMLGKVKKTNPNLIVGLMGCMVEEHKEKLFKRFPQLDLMVGTRNIKELPGLIEEVRRSREQVSRIKQEGISIEYTEQIKRPATESSAGRRGNPYHAWLPIMTGCDKVCTFCIVPITRGPEVSMPAREVYREASRLVEEGVKWITLLGQNVNSYNGQETIDYRPQTTYQSRHSERSEESQSRNPSAGGGQVVLFTRQRAVAGGLRMTSKSSFPELLEMLCEIPGLERISFTTSHPHDATEELYRVIARNPKISRRFHLPLQSGSDRILKRMKRLHTFEEYKRKIDRMREMIPGISITTDIIAGFSGETEEDHRLTLQALEEIRYDGAYIYKYSVRPLTPAAKLPDDVPLHVKEKRNAELLAAQKRITREINEQFLGKTLEVFAEEISPKNSDQVLGRTDAEKKVAFPGDAAGLGRFQKVKLEVLRNETFLGIPLV